MRYVLARSLLLCLLCCLAGNAQAQVRVGRMRGLAKEEKKREKAKRASKKRKPADQVVTQVTPARMSEARTELDARFYVSWNALRGLQYDDFLNDRFQYNKFLPARDTDLAKVIYPDYREFYKRLSERLAASGGMDDKFWQEKVDKMLRERPDSFTSEYTSVFFTDTGYAIAISIDSPAASSITVSPVIYPVNEHTYYYNITALFNRYESWMIVKSTDILVHEQIHFDIFELYARKMRKYLTETLKQHFNEDGAIDDVSDDINLKFEEYYQRINDMQLEFDRQTAALTSANASLLQINARWTQDLKQQIDALKEYAVPEGTITLQ